jgi:hypothetical protein
VKRRCTLTLISTAFVWLWIAFPVSNAVGQSAADVEGVKEASKNFYAALAVLDNGEAMEKVWAHTPYVTYVGPRHTSVLVGWDAQKKYWPEPRTVSTRSGPAKPIRTGRTGTPITLSGSRPANSCRHKQRLPTVNGNRKSPAQSVRGDHAGSAGTRSLSGVNVPSASS